MSNRCIFCGDVVPEGRYVCPICEFKFYRYSRLKNKKRRDKSKEDFDEDSEEMVESSS